jgi:microcystin-dependent protein
MFVSHPKVPNGTKINAISGTTLTLSNNASATVSASAARFSPLLDAQTLGATGGALSQILSLAQIPTGITSSNLASVALSVASTVADILRSSLWSLGGGFNQTGGFGFGFLSNPAGAVSGIASTGNIAAGAVPVTSNNTGGQGHANVQPTIVMNFMIKR